MNGTVADVGETEAIVQKYTELNWKVGEQDVESCRHPDYLSTDREISFQSIAAANENSAFSFSKIYDFIFVS